MNPQEPIERVVLAAAVTAFQANKELAERAVAQLPDEQLHVALDENTNSIAIIMKHVGGNLVSRWTDFLATDGEKPWRDRDQEFVDTFASRKEVFAAWQRGWDCLFAALHSLQPEDLARTITIRDRPHSVPEAIDRALAHCGYHVGQIVMIARILAQDNWQTLTMPPAPAGPGNRRIWRR